VALAPARLTTGRGTSCQGYLTRRGLNGGQHVWQLVAHGHIGEAKHPVPGRSQEGLTFGVVFALCGMYLAVDLDGETSFDAAEVKNEGSYGVLAAELQPIQTPPAQRRPKHLFGPRLASAQVASGGYVVVMTGVRSPWHGTSVAQLISSPCFAFPQRGAGI
jgi:hypothetical protein